MYLFMSNHSSDHYVPFCNDPLSHLAIAYRCVIMHEVVDESLRKMISLSTECAAALLSFRYPSQD